MLELRLHFEHHAVLVRLREDGGDQPLAEGVVQRVVDRPRRDAEPAAASRSISTKACRPWSCRSLATSASCGSCRRRSTSFGTHVRSSSTSAILERELVLRAADAVLDGQVLHRLHVERDARRRRASSRCSRRMISARVASRSPCGLRLISMRPLLSVELAPSTPMNDDRLSTAGSSRIDRGQRLLPLGHRRERDRLRRLGDALDHAGVLHREEALRHHDVEHHGQRQRAERHQQRQRLVVEHPRRARGRSRAIMPSKNAPLRAVEPALLVLRRPCFSSRAHIIGVRVSETTSGDQDRHRQRDGELAEQPADHVAHEQQRDQHRDQREGQRDDA